MTPMNESFYIWTFAYDVSGMKSVTLYVREDADGVNPLDDFANEVGGTRVGWGPPCAARLTIDLRVGGGRCSTPRRWG